jgi:hypothetical protein
VVDGMDGFRKDGINNMESPMINDEKWKKEGWLGRASDIMLIMEGVVEGIMEGKYGCHILGINTARKRGVLTAESMRGRKEHQKMMKNGFLNTFLMN